MWHHKESIPRTEILGKLAVRVCSKILGIGSAERAWGDVKHLKSNKRSHLSSDKVKKQATLFGHSSMEMARYKIQNTEIELKYSLKDCWFDDDLEAIMELYQDQNAGANTRRRSKVFNAWIEQSDIDKRYMNDKVAMHSLLHKYGGLRWMDGDKVLRSDGDKMRWNKITNDPNKNYGGGWFLIAYDDDTYSPELPYEDNRDSGGIEEIPLTDDLVASIATYYEDNSDSNITVKYLQPQFTEEAEHDSDDENDSTIYIQTNNFLP